MEKLSTAQQAQMEVAQFREFLTTYNRLSESCFMDCVNDFTSRKVTGKEDQCASHCVEKYLKLTQRLSLRIQEHQAQQLEAMGVKPGQTS
ncbi:mitochondrial import inner membrane translocase subunit Tim9-like [Corticium candelabrum]|uniref:mitochondrial import inner membrane translocase subunit Tim9-like n=1 Tax=Corticium candelabrum TaxID=121492 RepID=UPI002E2739DC|nr:mitochondrial import inner membrane translocase subunit Tim9-like [Corticium candelabrum]